MRLRIAALTVTLAPSLAAPLAAEAQQVGRTPGLGYLSNSSSETPGDSPFLQGLRDLGWTDGPS